MEPQECDSVISLLSKTKLHYLSLSLIRITLGGRCSCFCFCLQGPSLKAKTFGQWACLFSRPKVVRLFGGQLGSNEREVIEEKRSKKESELANG